MESNSASGAITGTRLEVGRIELKVFFTNPTAVLVTSREIMEETVSSSFGIKYVLQKQKSIQLNWSQMRKFSKSSYVK